VEAAITGPRPWGDVPQGSDSVANLAVANGAMKLAAPSCCRLGLLAGAHLVLLAGALDLPRSQWVPVLVDPLKPPHARRNELVCLGQPGVGVRLVRCFKYRLVLATAAALLRKRPLQPPYRVVVL
jgi:hypothetical protein